jgi:hypothetical protein
MEVPHVKQAEMSDEGFFAELSMSAWSSCLELVLSRSALLPTERRLLWDFSGM